MRLLKFRIDNVEIEDGKAILYFGDGDIKISRSEICGVMPYTLVNLIDNKIVYDLKKKVFENNDCFLYFKSEDGNYSPMEIVYLLKIDSTSKISKAMHEEFGKHNIDFKCIYDEDMPINFKRLMEEIEQFNHRNLIRKYTIENNEGKLKELFAYRINNSK